MAGTDDVARAVECRQCGNRIAADALGPTLQCPYCRAEQAVDPAVLHQAQRYEQRVDELGDAAHEAQRHAAVWGPTGRAKPGPHPMNVGFLAGVVGAMGGGTGWHLLVSSGTVPATLNNAGPFVAIGTGLVTALVAAAGTRALARRPAEAPAVRANQVRCPGCGAPNAFRPGQTLETCKHCGGGLVASERAMASGVQAAEEATRSATVERYRTERWGVVNLYAMSARSSRPWLLGRERWDRFEAALERLASDDGQAIVGHRAIVGWLNRYWASFYPAADLVTGKASFGAALRLHGYPALVFADDGPMSGDVEPKVHLLLAAAIPGAPAEPEDAPLAADAAEEPLAELRRTAGEPELWASGLLLRLGPGEVLEVQSRPERLSELRPALETMVRAARALDAPPGRPVP